MSRVDPEMPRPGTVDMSGVEFRRPRLRSAPTESHQRFADLWWQIALGVFLGLLAHSVVVGLYGRWEMQRMMKQWEAESAAFGRQMQEAMRENSGSPRAANPSSVRTAPPVRPLAQDERCVSGKRFRKVENGWVQVLEACR